MRLVQRSASRSNRMIGQATNGSGIWSGGKYEMHATRTESLGIIALSLDLHALGLSTFLIDKCN